MTRPSVGLLLATCRALDVTPTGYADGRLTLTGPPDVLPTLLPLVRAQQAAFLSLLAEHSADAYQRQREGFRSVRVYDVAEDTWHDVPRWDRRSLLNDCGRDPQRADILAAFAEAITPHRQAA